MKALITITLFLVCFSGFSQPLKSCFFADTSGKGAAAGYSTCKRGCAPLKVIMNDTCSNVYKNPSNPKPLYYWGDAGNLAFASDTHTYFKPGIYNITQHITPQNSTTSIDTTIFNYMTVLASPPPPFTVAICQGKLIKLTINDNTYDTYSINFGDGTTIKGAKDTTVLYTYSDTSSHKIIVTGSYNLDNGCGCQNSSSKTITPLGHLVTPDVTSLTVTSPTASGQVALNFNALSYLNYEVQSKSGLTGTYSPLKYISDTTQGSITLNFLSNNCYRISNYDQCGDTLSSEDLCSTNVTATAQNNQNVITWNNNVTGTFNSYIISRNNVPITTLTSPATSYTDTNIHCGVNYCYTITYQMQQTDQAGKNIQSISAPACTTAISNTTPPVVTGLTATVKNNAIVVNWNAAAGVKKYVITKTDNGNADGNATVATNLYNDPSAISTDHQYCYTVAYTDSCGNASPVSYKVCPSILNIIDNNNGTINLNWTPYVDSTGVTSTYTINILDNNGNVIASYPAGTNLSYIFNSDSTDKTLNFQIVTTYGNSTYYSNIYSVERSLKLFIPDAFTPNGDGNNDVFIPKVKYLKTMQMTIFNRWGEIVFHTDSFTAWDGTFKGNPANVDSYAYAITATDIWGEETTKRGTVTLLK